MGVTYCLHMNQLDPPFTSRTLNSSSIFLTEHYSTKISNTEFWKNDKDAASMQTANQDIIVYKFGILLLEVISGRLPFSEDHGLLVLWASSYLDGKRPLSAMPDPMLRASSSVSDEDLAALCDVVRLCINCDTEKRPSMNKVASLMKGVIRLSPEQTTPRNNPLCVAMATDAGTDGEEATYDPMKDPERRPQRSNDPDGSMGCPRASTDIRREMGEYLEKNRRNKGLLDDDDDAVVEVDAATMEPTAQASLTRQSSGTAAKKNKKAFAVKMSSKKCQSVAAKSIVSMLRRKPEEVVDERRSGFSQSTMESSTKTAEERHYVNIQWALFFYECGIPFNVASSRQFQVAIEASCQYGSGYKPPSPHELREPLLRDCVKETKLLRKKHEEAWKQYGCTLMSDGWSDRRGRHLINFLVNSPEGTYFLESIDASSECQDAHMLADLLENRIEDVGKENVVQVVTDNGANYKAAGKLLMERIPTLYWSPCACHCLDLMLEDIGKLKAFKKPIARGRRVTTFIYRHGRILSLMRKATGGMDLVRPAATRFATTFLSLKSLVKHKQALRSLFTCQAWTGNKLAKTQAGLNVQDIILSAYWWHSVEDCLRASAPLLIVLRLADGDEVPAMPEIAALMKHAKERINLGFPQQNKQALLKRIMTIVDKRWETQMDHPLYGAALFLNPGKFSSIVKSGDDALVGELRSCFNDVLAKTVLDVNTRNKIDQQAVLYVGKRGAFSNVMAIENMEKRNPRKSTY
ncbi:hypothetical protein ACQ4PT_023976 [Festuca glaucescens]